MAETKHIAISEELRSRILSRHYSRRLPSVRRLAAEFSTSVRTMGKSLKSLAEEGLITPTNNGTLIRRVTPQRSKGGVVNIVFETLLYCGKENDVLLNELQRQVKGDGFIPVLNEVVDRELFADIDYWVNAQVEGHIFIYSSFYNFLLRQLNLQGVPYVVGNWLPVNYGVHWVDFNNEQRWYSLVEQIIERSGNHRIAFTFPGRIPSIQRWMRERWQAIAEHFDLPDYGTEYCFTTDLAGTAKDWARLPEPPQMVICDHRDCQALQRVFAKHGLPLQIITCRVDASAPDAWTYEAPNYRQLAERTWQVFKAVLDGTAGSPRSHLIDYHPHLEMKGRRMSYALTAG